jgi:hypothetical protein
MASAEVSVPAVAIPFTQAFSCCRIGIQMCAFRHSGPVLSSVLLLMVCYAKSSQGSIPQLTSADSTAVSFFAAQDIAARWTQPGEPSATDVTRVVQTLSSNGVKTDADVESNPFLKALVGSGQTDLHKRVSLGAGAKTPVAGTGPTSPFSFDLPTAVADYFGTAIANQARTYLISAVLQTIQTQAAKTDLAKPLKIMLPKTSRYLAQLTPADRVDPTTLTNLREDAKQDLAALPENLEQLVATFDPNKDLATYSIHILVTAGTLVYAKEKPAAVIDKLEVSGNSFVQGTVDPSAQHVDAVLKFVTIVSHILRMPDRETWLPVDKIEACLNGANVTAQDKEIFVLAALGLSYAHDGALYDAIPAEVGESGALASLVSDAKRLDAVVQLISGIGPSMQQLTNDTNALSKATNGTVDLADVTTMINHLQTALSLIVDSNDGASALANSVFPTLASDIAQLDVDLGELSTGVDLLLAAKQKNYVLLWQDAITLIPVILVAPSDTTPGGKAQIAFVAFFKSGVGKLLVDLPKAKTTADFEAILNSDLNTGNNYEAKQLSAFSIDLNGFLGVEAGRESLIGDIGTAARRKFRAGVFAPVGVELTWGTSRGGFFYNDAAIGSFSAFVSVIDVGAVASYRAGGGTGSLPSVTWSNIVAPGIFAVVEFRDLPFCILIGSEYGPGLRSVTSNGIQVQKPAFQAPLIAFAFDASFPNLFRTQR